MRIGVKEVSPSPPAVLIENVNQRTKRGGDSFLLFYKVLLELEDDFLIFDSLYMRVAH